MENGLRHSEINERPLVCVCCCFVLFLCFVVCVYNFYYSNMDLQWIELNLIWTKEYKCIQLDIFIVIFPVASFKCGLALLILKKWFYAAAAAVVGFVVFMSIASCISKFVNGICVVYCLIISIGCEMSSFSMFHFVHIKLNLCVYKKIK